jgi:uncharacterized Rmd1/YagE family protein
MSNHPSDILKENLQLMEEGIDPIEGNDPQNSKKSDMKTTTSVKSPTTQILFSSPNANGPRDIGSHAIQQIGNSKYPSNSVTATQSGKRGSVGATSSYNSGSTFRSTSSTVTPQNAPRIPLRTTSSKLPHAMPKTVLLPDNDHQSDPEESPKKNFGINSDAQPTSSSVSADAESLLKRDPEEGSSHILHLNDLESKSPEVELHDPEGDPMCPKQDDMSFLNAQSQADPKPQYSRKHILEISDESSLTVAESLPKQDRKWMPRCTAYLTANKYRMSELINYLVTRHRVQIRAYDECLYVGYPQFCHQALIAKQLVSKDDVHNSTGDLEDERLLVPEGSLRRAKSYSASHLFANEGEPTDEPFSTEKLKEKFQTLRKSTLLHTAISRAKPATAPMHVSLNQYPILPYGEVCFFEYGVTVCWGMTEKEEQWLLKEISQFHDVGLSSSVAGLREEQVKHWKQIPLVGRVFSALGKRGRFNNEVHEDHFESLVDQNEDGDDEDEADDEDEDDINGFVKEVFHFQVHCFKTSGFYFFLNSNDFVRTYQIS